MTIPLSLWYYIYISLKKGVQGAYQQYCWHSLPSHCAPCWPSVHPQNKTSPPHFDPWPHCRHLTQYPQGLLRSGIRYNTVNILTFPPVGISIKGTANLTKEWLMHHPGESSYRDLDMFDGVTTLILRIGVSHVRSLQKYTFHLFVFLHLKSMTNITNFKCNSEFSQSQNSTYMLSRHET